MRGIDYVGSTPMSILNGWSLSVDNSLLANTDSLSIGIQTGTNDRLHLLINLHLHGSYRMVHFSPSHLAQSGDKLQAQFQ